MNIRLYVVGLCALLSISCGLCSDEVIKRGVSADGKRAATFRVRDCGATTTWNGTLLVELPDKREPVTVFSRPLCAFKPEHFDLRWEGSDLVVICKGCCVERLDQSPTQRLGATTVRFEGFERR